MIKPILLSSNDELLKQRTRELASKVKLNLEEISNLDAIDIESNKDYSCVLIDCRCLPLNQIAGSAQIVSQFYPDAKTTIIVSNKLKPEDIRFMYTSGANLILNEKDFFNYNKIDFYLNYVLNNEWIPIKAWDFVENTEPPFDAYHYIPYKNKFFSIVHGAISSDKLAKMKTVGEIYIKRTDLELYTNYIKSLHYTGSDNVLRVCRAKYLEFYDNYVELIYQLSDDSKYYSFEEGKQILEKSLKLASELLTCLSAVPDPWLIVNNLTFELDGVLSRIPAIAAYVGITALLMDLKNPDEIRC